VNKFLVGGRQRYAGRAFWRCPISDVRKGFGLAKHEGRSKANKEEWFIYSDLPIFCACGKKLPIRAKPYTTNVEVALDAD